VKLVILMHLEDDTPGVEKLLADHEVAVYTELPVLGHGQGAQGWYGEVSPYRSRMLLAFLAEDMAAQLIDAVEECTTCQHPAHPVHAWVVDVERSVVSGVSNARTRGAAR
jgi:hypothetical protein